jgi:hypothetical protein
LFLSAGFLGIPEALKGYVFGNRFHPMNERIGGGNPHSLARRWKAREISPEM